MTHPNPQDQTTPAAPTDAAPTGAAPAGGAPAKQHGDPLLAASEGATENTEGSRQGFDSDALAPEQG